MPLSELSLLLKGGTVYDGTGAPPYKADLGISGDTIAFVSRGAARPSAAGRIIDLTGLCLSPGFIDAHGHSEFALLAHPLAESKTLQGITTEVGGNCGLSAGPLYGEAMARREGDLKEHGIAERWHTLEEYFQLLEARGSAINFATLAGHGNIRASAMGYSDRKPSEAELAEMKRLLADALKQGAIGLSTGLIYPPGIYAEAAELIELVRHGLRSSEGNFIYTSHMRSEGKRLLDAAHELLTIGRETGARVHISHIKTAGRENWHKIDALVEAVEGAQKEGVQVTCDRYPYTASSTDLDAVLPKWAFEGGSEEELKRLKDPATLERIRRGLPTDQAYWSGVFVSTVTTEADTWMEGKNIADIAARMGVGLLDAFFRVLIDERLRVGAIFHGMSEENLKRLLALPYAMVGTDSSARPLDAPGRPHPRGAGSFPRYLKRYAPTLEEGVRRATSLPARTFGLRRRGEVKEGYYADLVAFDPGALSDRATYDEPLLPPAGIRHVFVNGRAAVADGSPTGERPGRALRNGGA